MTKKATKPEAPEPVKAETPSLVDRIKSLPKGTREKEAKAELKYRGKDRNFREAWLEAHGVTVTPAKPAKAE